MDKQTARENLLEKRRQITFKRRNAKSLKVIKQLTKVLEKHKNIGIYLSLKDEVNTTDYLNYFLENFERVSASVIEDNSLVFYKVNSLRELKPGYMDVLEPLREELTEKSDMDAIIVPMVGFDQRRNRMGYGKGFYDRYLKDYTGVIIGLAFEESEMRHLPHDENDVRLDYVITDNRVFKK